VKLVKATNTSRKSPGSSQEVPRKSPGSPQEVPDSIVKQPIVLKNERFEWTLSPTLPTVATSIDIPLHLG
jgi:hypothetical protein